MTAKKQSNPFKLGMNFEEALGRLAQTSPKEVTDAIARDVAKKMREATKRIDDAREDVKRGAKTGKKRFRL